MIQQPEFDEWLKIPATIEFFKALEKTRADTLEDWASSRFVGALDSETIQKNAYALGEVTMLRKVLDITLEEINQIIYDDET